MNRYFNKLLPLLIIFLMVMVIPQAFASDAGNITELSSEIVVGDYCDVAVDDNQVKSGDILNSDESNDIFQDSDSSDAIYVSTDGDDKNNGSESAPFSTIYRAVNVALDSGVSNIYIKEGNYKENSIPIETSVNIIGLGNVVIDAEKNDRIFKIDGEYEVTLSNLTLMNGVAPTDGISEDIHEIVYYAGGGAISIVTAYVTMNYMTFINNVADDFGGAINVEAPNCLIRNSVFISNYAEVFGGAIDFEDNNGTVDNCTFIANEAGNGGAIGYIAAAGTIINSHFENNTAENGAAIFIENDALTSDDSNSHLIQNNKFIHNEAIQQGGAIEVENQMMSENADWTLIDNNEFIDNYAYNGGAISAYYGDAGIRNNKFINNSAGYGGAIASISTTDSPYIIVGGLYMKNNTIIDCFAEESGNAIYNMGYIGTTVNITFVEGKTVYSKDGKAVILNVSVCDDMGNPISGSAIDFTVNGKATINPANDLDEGIGSVRFVPRENGTFVISGVFKNKFDTSRINLVTGNITVENAIADYFGTIYVSGAEGDDDNTGAEDSPVKTFNQAYILATREGGSFDIVVNKGTYSIPGYTIEKSFNITGIDNPVLDGKNQGTLFSLYGGPNDEFHITGLTFINGIASSSKYAGMYEGGAIFFKGGKLFLENDTFSSNSASDYGGAIHINKGMDYNSAEMYGAFAYVNNCSFNNNVAKYFGGGISLYDCDVIVNNSNFNTNDAKRGGAISILNGMGNLTVINSKFNKNTASEMGGALDVDALNTYSVRYFADISNSVFNSNSAKYGGAIIGCDNNISHCVFVKNSASELGGAVLLNDTESYLTYSIFEGNSAKEGYSFYGYTNLVTANFWGINFNNPKELESKNIAIIKNDTESRSWVNPIVVNDTNMPSWINVEIDGQNRFLPGNYEYSIKLVLNNGSDLENDLPEYSVKIANANSINKINATGISLSNKAAVLSYNASSPAKDTISVSNVNTGDLITSFDIEVYAKKSTAISVNNESYSILNESKTVSIILTDVNGNVLSNKTLLINVDGNNYTQTTDVNGSAVLFVNLTNSGIFDVKVEFDGDEDYIGSVNSSNVEIFKLNTQLASSNKTFLVTSKSNYVTVSLTDVDGNVLSNKTVTITANGKNYNVTTNQNGQASLKITLKAKTYLLSFKFNEDEVYLSSNTTATIKINKEKSKLKIPKKTYKKSKKVKKLTATLKSASGKVIAKKKVTFKVNGKKYTVKTNKKGVATVKVKLTSKKTYKVTVKFAGDSNYKSVIKTSSVKIK